MDGRRRDIADERAVSAGYLEDVAEYVGQPVATVKAQEHAEPAAQLDLLRKHAGIRPGRVGILDQRLERY